MVATGLTLEEAPGAAAADKRDSKNDRMFIIETTEIEDYAMSTPQSDRNTAHTILTQFKRRNALLRRVLLYPNHTESCELDRSTSHVTIPSSQ
ncbi:hypothetical protein AX15_001102 [Amanita polypyramis BW_CC]|nr:hypothetical protein AX15_001102 [Amanita polypyramis BW_CC]